MIAKKSTKGLKALEITMRDVLDGLEDAATYMNYDSRPNSFQILSIEPADKPTLTGYGVIHINNFLPDPFLKRSTNIVAYLVAREFRRSA